MAHICATLRWIGRYWASCWFELIRPATPEEIAAAKRIAANH